MKQFLLFVVVVTMVSCSFGEKFEVEVNIENNSTLIQKSILVTQSIDGEQIFSDSFNIKKQNFKFKLPYKGPAFVQISVPGVNLQNAFFAAEAGIITLHIDGSKVNCGGTPVNDRLQAYRNESDSVSNLFKAIDDKFASLQNEPKADQEALDALVVERRALIKSNTDRTIAFTKENIDNPIGEYFFMSNYIIFPTERQLEMNLFASEKIKKLLKIE
jgi:hypothetical protein